jgi:ferrous iron transport protein B
VVVAINMMDMVEKFGDKIDLERLSKALGCKLVPISALKGTGVIEAANQATEMAAHGKTVPKHSFSGKVEHALAHIEEAVLHDMPEDEQRWYAIKLFERDEKVLSKMNLSKEVLDHIDNDIKLCEQEMEDDSESIIISERYAYIDTVVKKCCDLKNRAKLSTSDKIDRVLTHRIFALPIFALIMFIVYFVSVTSVGTLVTDFVNDGVFGEGFEMFGAFVPGVPVLLGDLLAAINCAEWLQSLILDGIVAGVGAVIGFVPQILILFIFLAFLEGCGYMSRIAFILDRIFRHFGLSGKSFIPILVGTGCGVPGIMASRAIENERDRRMTIITTTFIPCSAKLPIIALISGALFGGAWWVAPSAYFVGIAAIVCSGIILKKTRLFSGEVAPFVMELPTYHMPTVINILRSMWERGWSFIKRAGTIILLAAVFVWFTSGFGWSDGVFGMVDMQESILARIGSGLAWIFAPLGFGRWEAAVATFTGLIAKENVVGTMGVLFGFAEMAEDGSEMWNSFAATFSVLGAYAFLVFNLLCAPCVAAMGAIKREMNNIKWFWIAIGYQCGFAYIVSLCVYQIGMLLSGNGFGAGSAAALLIFAAFLFMLFRPGSDGRTRGMISSVGSHV